VQGVTQEPISHGAVLVNNSFVQEGGDSFLKNFCSYLFCNGTKHKTKKLQ